MIIDSELQDLKEAAKTLQSPLLRKVVKFVEDNTDIREAVLSADESYKAGALAALRAVWEITDHTRIGHPEEETVHVMACELSQIGHGLDVESRDLWRGFE